MLKKLTIFLICALTIAFNVQAQTFEAKVNRTEIPEGETFLLTLDLSGAQTNKTPDLGVLDKDFIIYSVSNAYTTKVINNDISQTRQWNLVLMPKNTGALQIPSIKLDQLRLRFAKQERRLVRNNKDNRDSPVSKSTVK